MNLKPMFSSKFSKWAAGLLIFAIAALGVLHFLPNSKLKSFLPKAVKAEPINSLSGRSGSDGPILAVKIDDTKAAHPQAGLEDADLVYIEQVEGGLTRLAALYSSKIPAIIGPIRSARISDIEILQQYGHVAFAYSGAQRKMLPVIKAANLQDLGAQRQPPSIYANDPLRRPPTAMMLQAPKLMEKIVSQNYQIAISKSAGWQFGDRPDTGTAISKVKISWPANSYTASWSASEKRWLLSQKTGADISASGLQLGPTTLVIQSVSITNSIYHDKVGGITPYSKTVGTGTGFVLRDGYAIDATWSRESADSGTTWKTLAGEEIKFAPGQVWIALTDKTPKFTPVKVANSADATSPATK